MERGRRAIPRRLNAALAVCACGASLALLWTASHAGSWIVVAAAALAFSYTNNTVFALLHESVHGLFDPEPRVNDRWGRVLAAFFPTALTFHRTCHLGHHRRNRTAVELFDYYTPEDSRLLKRLQWYGILTGLYWLLPPLTCLLILVVPFGLVRRVVAARGSAVAEHTGAEAMLAGFAGVPMRRLRLEIVLSLALQALFCLALELSVAGWLACYAAFGVNWSSLQYADHAWSPLDVRHGAWNLGVNRVVRALFLNYHDHLAHHLHPDVPWIDLPLYVDPAVERPAFWRVYLDMWRGPRPLPPALAPAPLAGAEARVAVEAQ